MTKIFFTRADVAKLCGVPAPRISRLVTQYRHYLSETWHSMRPRRYIDYDVELFKEILRLHDVEGLTSTDDIKAYIFDWCKKKNKWVII